MIISIIVAKSKNNVIGIHNQLPWHLPADLKYFKKVTFGHTVIMGRKTYESVGKPLPGRTNIVITRQADFNAEGVIVGPSLELALKNLKVDEVFILGGGEVFRQAMNQADKLFITDIDVELDGEVFFPEIDANLWSLESQEDHLKDEKNPYDYSFKVYKRKI